MSRDYVHEDWIPWYTRDTAGWLELSLAARGAAEGIARKMGKDRNELPLGSRGLRGLAVTLHCPWEDLEPALIELLSPGPNGEQPRLVHDTERNVLRDEEASARRRPTSSSRVAAHRAKRASEPPPSDVTHETVTSVTSVSKHPETGVTVPSTLLSSDLRDQEDPEIPSARARDPEPPGGPPPWFGAAIATVQGETGETLRPPECWLRYRGHRANKGIAPNQQDAVYWLTTVMVPEARKERRGEADKRERDARWAQQRAGPPEPVRETPEQAKKFAADLAARVAERKARESKGAT